MKPAVSNASGGLLMRTPWFIFLFLLTVCKRVVANQTSFAQRIVFQQKICEQEVNNHPVFCFRWGFMPQILIKINAAEIWVVLCILKVCTQQEPEHELLKHQETT